MKWDIGSEAAEGNQEQIEGDRPVSFILKDDGSDAQG
jgi:hypothetical protein